MTSFAICNTQRISLYHWWVYSLCARNGTAWCDGKAFKERRTHCIELSDLCLKGFQVAHMRLFLLVCTCCMLQDGFSTAYRHLYFIQRTLIGKMHKRHNNMCWLTRVRRQVPHCKHCVPGFNETLLKRKFDSWTKGWIATYLKGEALEYKGWNGVDFSHPLPVVCSMDFCLLLLFCLWAVGNWIKPHD